MIYQRALTLAMCLALFGVAWGCGEKEGGEKIGKIAGDGTLSVGGDKFGPALLSFVHTTDTEAPTLEAKVKDDGTFDVLTFPGQEFVDGKYKVVLDEDPAAEPEGGMSTQTGVPVVKEFNVDIKSPAEGETLKLEIKLISTGKTRTGGPMP